MTSWDEMVFWQSGEWQAIQEHLDALELGRVSYNPKRQNLFAALDACTFKNCEVCILGQDPYPDATSATGIAFSIPPEQKKFPPTLVNILAEYASDLHYPFPGNGDLSPWCAQGVLLWNVVPTCLTGQIGSHADWTEWSFLTLEIVEHLSNKGIIFVLLGGRARDYLKYIDAEANTILSYSHPSPLAIANVRTKQSFKGCRVFSTINSILCKLKKKPIDWFLST